MIRQYRIILSADTASEVPQPPERCLSRKAGIVRCCHKEKPGGEETAGKRRLILAFYCKLCYI